MKAIWTPTSEQVERAQITAFAREAEEKSGRTLATYDELHRWSIEKPADFWGLVWDSLGVVADKRGSTVLADGERMPGASWFPEARLNFAQNLLKNADDREAIIFNGEDQVEQTLTRRQLHDAVARFVLVLKELGVEQGDRVAGYMPNMPETIIAMLAAACMGAVWSSCSPDFGVNGIVDRFEQVRPKVLIAADGVFYNGKRFDNLQKIAAIKERISSIRHLVIVPYINSDAHELLNDGALSWPQLLAQKPVEPIDYAQLSFDHPLYIMFSSGTTGIPKSIVHGAGGTLLQHLKEHQLHCNIKPGDRVYYFTTCGWMMWNWLVSALASEAVVLLYDGSPFYPDGNRLWDYALAQKATLFGTSAKYIDALRKENYAPVNTHDLSALTTICSTGSPLVPESFDYVYKHIKQDVNLASISGGTDILSCFALGNPALPVYRGELQCRGLGMAVDVFDDEGKSVRGEKGDLVCTKPFPSMPTGFWNDESGEKYHKAYFARFENIWCHGDYVELTEHNGLIFHGRSDAVLNPGGVRIGTAEIYRQVEQLDEVVESIAIGQDWQGDVRLVLFVKLRKDVRLDEALELKIRKQIRANTTPRHVPAIILEVSDIPRTKSGKIVELAVRDVVHNRQVANKEALANAQALEEFRNRIELQS